MTNKNCATQAIIDKLTQIAKTHDNLDVSSFRLIGLKAIRKAYGERWPERCKKVLSISEQFIQNRLDPDDLLISGTKGFIVLFVGADSEKSTAKAAKLSCELNAFIIGQLQDPLGPRTSVETTRLPTRELIVGLETGEMPRAANKSFLPPNDQDEDEDKTSDREDDSTWRFMPLWNRERQVIIGYHLLYLMKETKSPAPVYFGETAQYASKFYEDIDLESIAIADDVIDNAVKSHTRCMIGTSVHLDVMSCNEGRVRILSALSKLDYFNSKYRVLKIPMIPTGFPPYYLKEIIGALKKYCDNVIFSMSTEEPNFSELLEMGASSVGVCINDDTPSRHKNIESIETRELFRSYVTACHKLRVPFFVEGHLSPEIVKELGALGVDYFSSCSVWPLTPKPQGVYQWPQSNLEQARPTEKLMEMERGA